MNGEVECFTGGHIALGMLAILVLLAALLLIPCIILVATGRLKAVSTILPLDKDGHLLYTCTHCSKTTIIVVQFRHIHNLCGSGVDHELININPKLGS